MLIALMLLQAAAPLPDIQIGATIRARSVSIEKHGDASITVRGAPDGGSLVDVRAPRGNGKKTLRNVSVDLNAEARIADRQAKAAETETSAPQ
jgi:hypothetical protein